jgi:hypothetical protein
LLQSQHNSFAERVIAPHSQAAMYSVHVLCSPTELKTEVVFQSVATITISSGFLPWAAPGIQLIVLLEKWRRTREWIRIDCNRAN